MGGMLGLWSNGSGADASGDDWEDIAKTLASVPEDAEGEVAQHWVDTIYKLLGTVPRNSETYTQSLDQLRELCGRSLLLPSPYMLSDVDFDDKSPYSAVNYADVWHGQLGGVGEVAVKVLRVTAADVEIKKIFYREAAVWTQLKHPNVLPFLGVTSQYKLCSVIPWMAGGTITSYATNHPEKNKINLVLDAFRGLEYLHSTGLVHGELKPTNVLVDGDGRAALADVGIAILLSSTDVFDKLTLTSALSGFRCLAPELCDPEGVSGYDCRPTFPSDVYSLGMILWEVYSGHPPFAEIRYDVRVIKKVLEGSRPERPPSTPDDVWDLIQLCWNRSPHERPTASSVVGRLELHV